MTENLYLIAHVVRGKPAFDIAERCESMGSPSDPGPWWIIPTFGHRAYPYRWVPLTQLEGDVGQGFWEGILLESPQGHRDFFSVNDRKVKATPAKATIDLKELGLI